jgi:hypothetical protein
MIFKQYREILDGTKSQTRRVVKPHERLLETDRAKWVDMALEGRDMRKWQVGSTYAVVPGRGLPAVVWRFDPADFCMAYDKSMTVSGKDWKAAQLDGGWREARIRITGIRQEPLQAISEADAIAEGVQSVADYRTLWESINGARSWDTNPSVWVITFELDRSLT